ncbi:type II secretion system protein G [Geobacter sp. OR-1]|uniref:type II secretion system protein n=1 Tax=Geobacter sp. OR-1 TaxID=1266765 RepID=UPI000542FFBB|nr:type II secretion system protein [Geobacter sp. OR-1]GAM10648.1 type II secretion system protein G [Geobacter sp. OR-1]
MRINKLLGKHFKSRSGVSLVELVVTMAILSILAVLVIPSLQLTAKRTKEIELRRSLRTIRTAIDDYKKAYDTAVKEKKITQGLQTDASSTGYPKTLKLLVEGDDFGGVDKNQTKKKFLRRIPVDPFNVPKKGEEPKWGIRAYKDEPDSKTSTGEAEDVYDVYSLSEETAIDGTKYKDW